MAIQDIFRALEEQGEKDSRDVIDAAKAQAKAIGADAEDQVEQIRAARVAAAEANVKAKATKIVNAARIDRIRAVSMAKDSGIDQVFTEAAGKLAKLRGGKEYEALFKALVEEAVSGLDGDVVIVVDQADEALAMRVVTELGLPATVDGSASTIGGVTVTAFGGRITRRNTFEDRIRKVRRNSQSETVETLFA
jgi:vacuolar-type H+-ATPase subunit E/Vma4